jgi:hypothetical protein
MRHNVLLISLLLLASLLVDAVVLSIVSEPRESATIAAVAFAFGQTNLVAIWFALGNTPMSIRFVAVFAVAVGWVFALCIRLGDSGVPDIVIDLLVQASLVAVPLLVIRLLGCEVFHTGAAGDADRRPGDLGRFQFSIRQILGWTTAIAVVLGVMKYVASIGPLEFRDFSDFDFVAFMIVRAVIALAALWGVLGSRWPILRFAVLGVLEVMAILAGQRVGILGQDLAAILKFHLAEAMVLLGSLWVVRVAGYRLRFVRRGA